MPALPEGSRQGDDVVLGPMAPFERDVVGQQDPHSRVGGGHPRPVYFAIPSSPPGGSSAPGILRAGPLPPGGREAVTPSR